MNYEPLDRFLDSVTKPVYSAGVFGSVRDALKGEHGEHGWIRAFVKESKGLTPADGRKYESARKQVERWAAFEKTGKYNPDKSKAAGKAEIAAVAYKQGLVGRDVPRSGISLTVDFRDTSTKKRQQDRSTPTLHMDYATALQYVNEERPDYAFLFDLWGDKKIGESLFGEDGAYPADILDVY